MLYSYLCDPCESFMSVVRCVNATVKPFLRKPVVFTLIGRGSMGWMHALAVTALFLSWL